MIYFHSIPTVYTCNNKQKKTNYVIKINRKIQHTRNIQV
jgi:hypothetical protein